jgi:hypothetical protein
MFTAGQVVPYTVICILVIIPFWKIFKKAGFSPYISLFTIVPIVNVLTLYFVAFSDWSRNRYV